MSAKGVAIAIRFGLLFSLLMIVWDNAHWSVALLLTLITINMELTGFIIINLQNQIIHINKFFTVWASSSFKFGNIREEDENNER